MTAMLLFPKEISNIGIQVCFSLNSRFPQNHARSIIQATRAILLRDAHSLSDDIPDPFLVSLFKPNAPLDPVSMCAGFDGGEWRCEEFARHLTEWIIDFSLRSSEKALISPGKLVSAVREAAARVFEKDSVSRGEAGEIMLHAICRQEFRTEALVARLYYKSSLDEQVHGFDCVHFRESVSDKIELWLGESKLFGSATSAIAKARGSIKDHLDRGFLKAQKTLILPKVRDENAALAAKVQHLFHKNTPLDEFLSAMIIPVLIACDSDAVKAATICDDDYRKLVNGEMLDVSNRVRKGSPFNTVKIQPIYVPLKSKEELRTAFGAALKGLQ